MRNFAAIVAMALAACLAMAMIGCSGGDYEKAKSLYDSGQFEEAAAIFEKLGDYEDSADMYLKCEYGQAKELYDSERYEKAEALFAQLGDYEDSAEMVGDCERGITLRDYGDVLKGLKGECISTEGRTPISSATRSTAAKLPSSTYTMTNPTERHSWGMPSIRKRFATFALTIAISRY